MATGDYTPSSFAEALLAKLGLPTSAANVDMIASWAAAEGGNWNNSATFNPLNTTLHMPGSGPMGGNANQNGGDPVQAYTSWQQGIDATAKTLSSGRYTPVLAALKQSNASVAAQAVVNSGWGTHSISLGSGASYNTQAVQSPQSATGTGTTGPIAGAPTTPAPGQNVDDYLSGQYGYLTSFLKDPEIGPILKEAAAGGWSDNKLEGALSNTNWWKTTGATARSWTSLNKIDPATAKQTLNTSISHITALAQSSGVHLNASDIYHMAYAANMFGWSDLQLQQAVGAQYKYNPKAVQAGAAGTDISQMKQLAADYLVPVSDQTLQKYAQASLSGNYNMSDFESYVKQQSLSLFSNNKTITDQINAGIKPTTAVDPYRQLAAQYTETPPDAINFMDPKWMKAINQVDPKTGASAPMSLGDWATQLRTNAVYGYDKTQGGRDAATQLSTSLGQAMGFI